MYVLLYNILIVNYLYQTISCYTYIHVVYTF